MKAASLMRSTRSSFFIECKGVQRGEKIRELLQCDVAVIRRRSLLGGILDFFTLENRRVVAEQRNDIGLFLDQIFFSRMQRVHVFRMIDDRRCLLNHLIISRILDGRNNLLPDCPQGQKLGRIVAGGITVAGKIEVAVVDLIVDCLLYTSRCV